MPKVNMRKAIAVFFLLIPLAAFGQYISYWFQGWQRQGNARDAQEYFMVPGTGIYFTYAPTNRVIINASGTNVVNTNYVLKAGDSMTGPLTNLAQYITIRSSNAVAYLSFEVPDPIIPGVRLGTTISWNTNRTLEFGGSTNVFDGIMYGDGSGLSNLSFTTTGVTTTQYMTDFMLGQITNVYSNGLLVITGPYVVPITPLLGAGGDAMLGAGEDAMTGAGG